MSMGVSAADDIARALSGAQRVRGFLGQFGRVLPHVDNPHALRSFSMHPATEAADDLMKLRDVLRDTVPEASRRGLSSGLWNLTKEVKGLQAKMDLAVDLGQGGLRFPASSRTEVLNGVRLVDDAAMLIRRFTGF